MGDAADLSCVQELERFLAVMAGAFEIPFLIVTSNHDGFYAGNFTRKADAEGKLAYTEFLLRDAEFLACIAPGGLAAYPAAELERAWKLTLLKDMVALINEMRKGNQQGAARIVSGMEQ